VELWPIDRRRSWRNYLLSALYEVTAVQFEAGLIDAVLLKDVLQRRFQRQDVLDQPGHVLRHSVVARPEQTRITNCFKTYVFKVYFKRINSEFQILGFFCSSLLVVPFVMQMELRTQNLQKYKFQVFFRFFNLLQLIIQIKSNFVLQS